MLFRLLLALFLCRLRVSAARPHVHPHAHDVVCFQHEVHVKHEAVWPAAHHLRASVTQHRLLRCRDVPLEDDVGQRGLLEDGRVQLVPSRRPTRCGSHPKLLCWQKRRKQWSLAVCGLVVYGHVQQEGRGGHQETIETTILLQHAHGWRAGGRRTVDHTNHVAVRIAYSRRVAKWHLVFEQVYDRHAGVVLVTR